jgi:cytochrome P450
MRLSNEQPPAALKKLPEEIRASLDADVPLLRQANTIMISRDDPDHARLRALVNKAFTPRMIERQRPQMEQLAHKLLDHMEQREQPDFIRDFATPFPIMIIAAMIGIPDEDLDQIKRWSDAGADFLGKATDTLEIFYMMAATAIEFNEYLRPYLEARRKIPQEDLLSAFLQPDEGADRLSLDEMIANTFLLLAAGNETTTNLLGNGLWALFKHPDQLGRLREHPELIEPAVEEMLRFESPSQITSRRARIDLEIAGERIGPDESIMLVLGAAHRDPAQFVDPDQFDIGRQENRHIAFGLGPHYCLGASLARLEAQITFPILLKRYPAISPRSSRALWRKNPIFLGIETLPVALA